MSYCALQSECKTEWVKRCSIRNSKIQNEFSRSQNSLNKFLQLALASQMFMHQFTIMYKVQHFSDILRQIDRFTHLGIVQCKVINFFQCDFQLSLAQDHKCEGRAHDKFADNCTMTHIGNKIIAFEESVVFHRKPNDQYGAAETGYA